MELEPQPPAGLIQPETQDSPVSVRLRRRRIGAWIVSDQELETLRSASNVHSLFFGLFGVAFGAAVSLIITLYSATFASVAVYAVFWACFWLMSFLSVCFAALTVIALCKSKNLVETIKEESEIRQAELIDRLT